MINVDGSYGLGSGQLVRYALSFSALSRKPIHITNIRSSRPSPGLKAQPLTAVKVLKKMCDASAPGIKIGSREIRFMPGELIGGNIKEDIGTAGSITLLIQNIIYPAMFAKEKTILEIKGGTDVNFSPTIDYTKEIFLPFIKKYVKSFSSGSTITLFSEFEKTIIGTDKLGAIGKKAEVVGEECAK